MKIFFPFSQKPKPEQPKPAPTPTPKPQSLIAQVANVKEPVVKAQHEPDPVTAITISLACVLALIMR